MRLGRELMKKVAFDIHGVIDRDPEFFAWLSHRLKDNGWTIHIVTGGKYVDNARLLIKWGVYYDHFYSITDHHTQLGTPMLEGCADGDMCIADSLWDRAKGDYCNKHGIHYIVDNTPIYEKFMIETHFEHWD